VATVIANSNRSKKQKAFKVSDFIPSFEPVKARQRDPKVIKAMLISFCQATGGSVTHG